ncbi:hypothetical protein BJ165DRAFT_1604319 [Panaeolus papilionaceus]|nr:hypothetical protein BJ165DRAFT_1604319 [Panaeolus papilionaceus]
MLSNGFTLFAAGLAAVAGVSAHSPPRAIHAGLAKRVDGDVQLHKRYSGTRWTFFDVGLGACGKVNVESDFIVALNAEQFGSGYPGPNCEKTITMTYNGKTATAKIMDMCPGCPYGGLDLSRSLFRYFAPEYVGVIQGDWNFSGSSSGGDAPAPAPAPQTTSTKVATPVSKPTTSSSKAPAPAVTTSTQAPAPAVTSAPARVTTSSRVTQATPATTSAARVASSSSPAPARASASSSQSSSQNPKTSVAPQFAAAKSFAAPSPTSSSAAAQSSSASVIKSASRASATTSKPSSTTSSSFVAPSSASASATPTDIETLIQNNIEAITTILSRLAELLQKLRLSRSDN